MFGRPQRPPIVRPGPNVRPGPKQPPKGADTKPGNPVVKPGPDVMPKPTPLPPKVQQAVGNAVKGPVRSGFKKGGSVDGCAKRGKTKGKMV